MPRQYRNAPLIEAVCEMRLSQDNEWDLTVPGLMYEALSTEFPKKDQRVVNDLEITQDSQGIKQQVQTSERIWFLTEDRKIFVQLGTRFLAINSLAPYPSWQGFQAKIALAYGTLSRVINIQHLNRVGLRYVNRIEIPVETIVKVEDYFEFYPFMGQRLPQLMQSFMTGVVLAFPAENASCRVQLAAAVPENPATHAFVLDIDYFSNQPKAIPPNAVLEWTERAHDNLENIFEGCITDKLRERFEGVK